MTRPLVLIDEQKLDTLLSYLASTTEPGAAVGVALDGAPVYRRGFGLANVETPAPLTPSMRMRIASMTKQFTAFAFLLACEERKARPEDSIRKFLPELNKVADGVSIAQLMSHTSGLRDAFDVAYHLSGAERLLKASDVLKLYAGMDTVNAPPGDEWNYNNGGYFLLSIALERILDRPLDEILTELVFTPLGMQDTMLRRFDTDFLRNSAALHAAGPPGKYSRTYVNKEHLGEGGVVSTIDDMLRWLVHMQRPTLGDARTWHMMTTPALLSNGASTHYGCGLNVGEYRGLDVLFHSGALLGCNSHFIKARDLNLDVVVLANRYDVSAVDIAYSVLNACLDDPPTTIRRHTLPVGKSFVSRHTGRVITFAGEREGKCIITRDGVDFVYQATHDDTLRPAPTINVADSVRLLHGENGPTLEYRDHGRIDHLSSVASTKMSALFAGLFKSEMGVEATIVRDPPTLRFMGPRGTVSYGLTPIGDNLWRAQAAPPAPWAGVVALDGSGFQFWTPRTSAIPFQRQRDPSHSTEEIPCR